MKKDEKNEEKKRMNPWFYAIFWLSRQKLARAGQARCEACGDAAQQGPSMKQEPAESALVETKPGFVGILALF